MTADQTLGMLVNNFSIRLAIGGSYGMHDYREPVDRDVLVHPDDWDILLATELGTLDTNDKGMARFSIFVPNEQDAKIECFCQSWPPNFGYTDIDPSVYLVNEHSVPYWPLSLVIKWKMEFGREKDKNDLMLILTHDWFNDLPLSVKEAVWPSFEPEHPSLDLPLKEVLEEFPHIVQEAILLRITMARLAMTFDEPRYHIDHHSYGNSD